MSNEIFGVVAIVAVVTIAAVSLATRDILGRRKKPLPRADDRLDQIAQQLAALQQSMDVTSVEVERLGEGLRFTTKLLAERNRALDPQRQPERVITPH